MCLPCGHLVFHGFGRVFVNLWWFGCCSALLLVRYENMSYDFVLFAPTCPRVHVPLNCAKPWNMCRSTNSRNCIWWFTSPIYNANADQLVTRIQYQITVQIGDIRKNLGFNFAGYGLCTSFCSICLKLVVSTIICSNILQRRMPVILDAVINLFHLHCGFNRDIKNVLHNYIDL